MKYNIGFADLFFRLVVGLMIILFMVNGDIPSGLWSIVLLLVAVIFIGTATLGKCPIYHFLGISTKPKES